MHIAYTRSSNIYDDSRATKEISTFLEQGYTVSVYGWNRDGKASESCKAVFKDHIEAVSLFFYSGTEGSGIKGKIIARYKWYRWLKNELLQNPDIDVSHACDYDTGAAVRKIAGRKNINYVYDIFDYYVDAHPVPRFIRSFVEEAEAKVINDSAAVIICTEERAEQIKKASPKRLVVIHNSPDVGAVCPVPCEYDYAYCGSMHEGRLIAEILDDYGEHRNLSFVFAGNGSFAVKAKKLSEENENFNYLGAIPYSAVLQTEAKARVISAIYDPSKRNHRLCAPNKFYEALALGKPVIVCRGTGIDKIVENNSIGIVIGYNADDFYKAVTYLCENETLCKDMGVRARGIYEDQYKWSLMKSRLIEIYSQITALENIKCKMA